MAGIDKSDFHALGSPQFSSTIGPHLDGAASLASGGDHRGVQAKDDVLSLVRIYKVKSGKCLQMSGVR